MKVGVLLLATSIIALPLGILLGEGIASHVAQFSRSDSVVGVWLTVISSFPLFVIMSVTAIAVYCSQRKEEEKAIKGGFFSLGAVISGSYTYGFLAAPFTGEGSIFFKFGLGIIILLALLPPAFAIIRLVEGSRK